MNSKKDFPKVYRDFIREQGIPTTLRRDQAQNEQSHLVEDIQREFMIKDAFSEAGNQQQNPVESGAIKQLKQDAAILMDRTNCPKEGALDALEYLADVHNILADERLGWITPHAKRTGETPDISAFLYYRFRQPIYYLDVNQAFPKSKERPGYWINVSKNVGDALTFVVRDVITNKRVHKSVVRAADDSGMRNHRAVFDERIQELALEETSHENGEDSIDPSDPDQPVQPPTDDAWHYPVEPVSGIRQSSPLERLNRPRQDPSQC